MQTQKGPSKFVGIPKTKSSGSVTISVFQYFCATAIKRDFKLDRLRLVIHYANVFCEIAFSSQRNIADVTVL